MMPIALVRQVILLVIVMSASVAPCVAMPADAREPLRASALARPWFSLGPANLSGRIQTITFDPTDGNRIYVGAAGGGVWTSTNGGRGWVPIGDDLPSLNIGAIAVVPHDPRILIVGTGDPVIGNDWIVGAG